MLDYLPVEVTSRIYSYVFPNGGISLDAEILISDSQTSWLGAELLCESFRQSRRYVEYRLERAHRGKPGIWHDEVEDAFFKGTPLLQRLITKSQVLNYKVLRWTYAYVDKSDVCIANFKHRLPSWSYVMISSLIYELTGIDRCRKQISSHIQVMKSLGSCGEEWSDQSTVRTPSPKRASPIYDIDLRVLQTQGFEGVLTYLPEDQPPDQLIIRVHGLYGENPVPADRIISQPKIILCRDLLSLAMVSSCTRREVFRFVEASLHLHPFIDAEDLLQLCKLIENVMGIRVTVAFATLIGGDTDAPTSTNVPHPSIAMSDILKERLPSLRTLDITLMPRFLDPRQYSGVEKSSLAHGAGWRVLHQSPGWGPRTQAFMDSMTSMRICVHRTVHWPSDRGFFEQEYVGGKGWKFQERGEMNYVKP